MENHKQYSGDGALKLIIETFQIRCYFIHPYIQARHGEKVNKNEPASYFLHGLMCFMAIPLDLPKLREILNGKSFFRISES